MLRWIGLSAGLCAVSSALGSGKVIHLTAGIEGCFLVVAALSAMVLISSYDAYETQGTAADSDD